MGQALGIPNPRRVLRGNCNRNWLRALSQMSLADHCRHFNGTHGYHHHPELSK